MSKATECLTTMDDQVLEVHFARESIITERFSVTTAGWHKVWLMTKYGSGYARTDVVMVKADAIAWSRYLDVSVWAELDPVNLIPQGRASKASVAKAVIHRGHEYMYQPLEPDQVDECGVKTEQIEGFGAVYYVEVS